MISSSPRPVFWARTVFLAMIGIILASISVGTQEAIITGAVIGAVISILID